MVVVLFLILWLIATPSFAVQSCPSNTVPVGNGVQIDPTCKKAPDAAINDAYSGVGACSANNWASTLNRDAAPTCTQPAFSSLSGSVACSQLPALTGDTTSSSGSCGTTTLKSNGNLLTSTTFGASLNLSTLLSGRATISSSGVVSFAAPYGATTYTVHGLIVGEAGSNLAATAACGTGTFLYGQGGSADPICSTLTMPNAATTGDILIATGTNAIGSLADVAVNQVLASGGVGAVPAYTSSPTISGANITSLNATNVSSGTLNTARLPVPITLSVSANSAQQLIGLTNTSNGASASTSFQVNNDAGHYINASINGSGGSNNGSIASDAPSGVSLYMTSDASWSFWTNGTNRFNLDSTGLYGNGIAGNGKGNQTINAAGYYVNGVAVTGSAVVRTPVAADDIISAIADTGENFASFLATSAITIQSFKIYVELAAGACTTKPTYDLVKGTTYNTVATTIKSACVASSETAVGVTDCGVTSATTGAAVAANTYVWIKVNTAASVCAPKNHVVWEYTMQ